MDLELWLEYDDRYDFEGLVDRAKDELLGFLGEKYEKFMTVELDSRAILVKGTEYLKVHVSADPSTKGAKKESKEVDRVARTAKTTGVANAVASSILKKLPQEAVIPQMEECKRLTSRRYELSPESKK